MRRAILQLVPSLNTGGVERGCLEILPAIKQAGFLPLVVSGGGAWVSKAEACGAEHVHLSVGKKNPLSAYGTVRRLCEVMESYNVCLVHPRSRMPAWVGYYAARRQNVPFVTSFHAAYNFKGGLKRRYNSVMVRGERVMAVSEFIKSHILENYGDYVAANRVSVVHNGIDEAIFNPSAGGASKVARLRRDLDLPQGKRWVVMVGRPAYWKGHALAIRALSRLADDSVALLFIVPNIADKAVYEFKKSADDLGLSDRVYWRSVGDDWVPTVYGLGDIYLSASTEPEAFGRTVAEAQAVGSIVMAPSFGGALDLVKDGASGFLFTPGDEENLAALLGRVLNFGKAESRKIVDAGIRSAKDFGLGNYRKKTLAIYEEVLKK